MTTIDIGLQGQILTATADGPIVAKSVGNVVCNVTADDSWADYAVTLVFATGKIQKSVQYTGGNVDVPWEVLDSPGWLWAGYAPQPAPNGYPGAPNPYQQQGAQPVPPQGYPYAQQPQEPAEPQPDPEEEKNKLPPFIRRMLGKK